MMPDAVGMSVHKFYPINTSLRALSRELAMPSYAIPSLWQKRAEMVRRIAHHEAELRDMRGKLEALDCAIRLFETEGAR